MGFTRNFWEKQKAKRQLEEKMMIQLIESGEVLTNLPKIIDVPQLEEETTKEETKIKRRRIGWE